MSTLAAEDVEAIASRVVELLASLELATTSALVDAATLARELGVSRAYVYEHATELGAVRLGSGPKARLRFNPERVLEGLSPQPFTPTATSPTRRRPQRSRVELLPIGRTRNERTTR